MKKAISVTLLASTFLLGVFVCVCREKFSQRSSAWMNACQSYRARENRSWNATEVDRAIYLISCNTSRFYDFDSLIRSQLSDSPVTWLSLVAIAFWFAVYAE